MGMKGDIIQAMDRRMSLFALLSSKGQMARSFIGWTFIEARKKRKKPIFLAPFSDISWIHSSIVDARGIDKGREGIVSIGKGVLNCMGDASYMDTSDVLNHCFKKTTIEGCPYQSGFDLETYREAKRSGGSILVDSHEEMKEKGMCPARMALDLAAEAEAVVADYSFLITEDWKSVLKFLERDGQDCVLVVHDPASFIRFLRKKFTYSLDDKDLDINNWDITGLSEDEGNGLTTLLELLSDLSHRTDPKKQIERRLLIEGFRERADRKRVTTSLVNVIGAVKGLLTEGSFGTISERKRAKELYMMMKYWLGQYTAVSRVRRESEDGDSIELSLIDLSIFTSDLLSSFSSVMLIGDTLYPHTIYSYTLGVRSEKIMNRSYIDKNTIKGTSILTMGNVDISFKHRSESSYQRIVENLSRISETTPGLKMAIFPSYFLMEQVMSAMAEVGFKYPVVEEVRGMSREEKNGLLDEIKVGGDLMALIVQGGHLARSMEIGAISPDTVVIVGLHLTPPDPTTSQMKVHLQKKYGPNVGHIISVLMPAITKVMNVVNGMVSSDMDRNNIILLMDRRYHDRRILECLPRFYNIKLLEGSSDFDGSRFLDGGDSP